MADRFEDARGVIEDILPGPIDCVTRITSKKGAIRGNHTHNATEQWTYVVSGRLISAIGWEERECGPGDLIHEPATIAHAWKALEDTTVLVFTRGPRSGADYESDTMRLGENDKLIR